MSDKVDFAVRFGYRNAPVNLMLEDMPDTLRNGLWDTTRLCIFEPLLARKERFSTKEFDDLFDRVWFSFFRLPVDERFKRTDLLLRDVKTRFFSFEFFDLYGFLEFVANDGGVADIDLYDRYLSGCNKIFERERAALRFADGILVQITNPVELSEVTASLRLGSSHAVSIHIRRAAELYSNVVPDYRNSIKESICAVESAVAYITQGRPSGVSQGLAKALEDHVLHPALRKGFEKLYAYLSDEGGIRHALLDDGRQVTQDDARYMLVSCSAFSNYLLALNLRQQSNSL